MLRAAGVTLLHVPTKHFRAAGLDSAHHFQVGGGRLAGLPVAFSIKTEHVGKFPARP